MLRTYALRSPCSETIQKVSPSRPFVTGVRRGRPDFRPVVSRIAVPGAGIPALNIAFTTGLTAYLARAVLKRRLSMAHTFPDVRIVAGRHKGRRLRAPAGAHTRPTADRVREALFSILGPPTGLRVLDLYAGSGALGVEALSRGAASATFVESARPAVAAIRANLAAIGEEDAEIVASDVLAWLRFAAGERAFDLVLCDPPYDAAARLAQPLSDLLPRVAGPQALIVTESAKRNPLALNLPLVDERTYGDTRIAIHRGS